MLELKLVHDQFFKCDTLITVTICSYRNSDMLPKVSMQNYMNL